MDMREIISKLETIKTEDEYLEVNDSFDIELSESFVIETGIVDIIEDGIIVEADQTVLDLLEVHDILIESEELTEAEYRGRKVPLGKPMAGDVKKSKVFVRKPNGKVVKVEFGDKNMRIKKSNPKRRKSFRARHRCENPGPRWKARYWSCRAW
jgi:NurA-like 5'-3' nuclease